MASQTTVQQLATRLSTTPAVVIQAGKALGLDLRAGASVVPAGRLTQLTRRVAEALADAKERR